MDYTVCVTQKTNSQQDSPALLYISSFASSFAFTSLIILKINCCHSSTFLTTCCNRITYPGHLTRRKNTNLNNPQVQRISRRREKRKILSMESSPSKVPSINSRYVSGGAGSRGGHSDRAVR